mgnify:CR=1 FL=1
MQIRIVLNINILLKKYIIFIYINYIIIYKYIGWAAYSLRTLNICSQLMLNYSLF